MFNHHRNTPWFQEKYSPDPEFTNLRQRTRQRGIRGRLPRFLEDLEAGKFDAEVVNDHADANGSTAKEEDASGTTLPAEAPAEEESKDNEEENADGDRPELNGKVDASADGRGHDSRRDANRGAEVSVPNDANQVMIRTIPPDIGRVKLERVNIFCELMKSCVLNSLVSLSVACLGSSMSRSANRCRSGSSTARAGSSSARTQTWRRS
jgi:hypothetical protein